MVQKSHEPTALRQILNARIRALLPLDPDPEVVARKVYDEASAQEKREIAALLLPEYVRSLMTEGHRHMVRPADRPRRGRTPGVYVAQDGRKFESARQRDLADWERITGASLASPDGGRKFFGEFTVQEVRWLSAQRTRQAEALLRQADRYREVAEVMAQVGVARVKDLPQARLVALMQADPDEESVQEVETPA